MVVDRESQSRVRAFFLGISPLALPAWDQKMGWNNLLRVLIAPNRTTGTRPQRTHPIHPPARDTLPPTAELTIPVVRRSLVSGQVAGDMASLVQRNSVRSIHMRCMMTASLQASATIAFC
jgi:hypothetical protein